MTSIIDRIVKTTDTDAFFKALNELWTFEWDGNCDKASVRLQTLLLASQLAFNCSLGLYTVMEDDETGPGAARMAEWCREIGAANTAECL